MDSLQGHVADIHEYREPVFEDQTKAQYKSGHSWFGKTVAQYPQQPGATCSSNSNTPSNQETRADKARTWSV